MDAIKPPRASSCVRWMNGELTGVLRTMFVLVIKELITWRRAQRWWSKRRFSRCSSTWRSRRPQKCLLYL